MKYYSNYDYFLKFKENLSKDIDVIISENKYLGFTMFFQEQSCNITIFNETLLPQLRMYKDLEPTEVLTGLIREIDLKKHDPYQIIFHGLMILYYEKYDKFYFQRKFLRGRQWFLWLFYHIFLYLSIARAMVIFSATLDIRRIYDIIKLQFIELIFVKIAPITTCTSSEYTRTPSLA